MSTPDTRRRVAAVASIVPFTLGVLLTALMLIRHLDALFVALISLGLFVIGAWWLLTESGILRYASALALVGGIGLLIYAMALVFGETDSALARVVLLLALFASALALARYAVSRPSVLYEEADHRRTPPIHPVLLCNPWSGGGKVKSFGLEELAEEMGVEIVMLAEGLDLERLARDAIARGADCIGMAGGDGSQALVASIAVEHGLPFVCIPAGTRNHFALDLGLDRNDPRAAMSAFTDAIERHVDYATVNDRLFVNNVSLGIYATIVQSDAYRDAKADVSIAVAKETLGRQSEPFDLQYSTPSGQEVDDAFLVMVSNNPYVLDANPDVSQRYEVDGGVLGVFAISTRTGGQAARLMTLSALGLRDMSKHWYEFKAQEFEVRSKSGKAYLGVDGEALQEDTPLRFKIHAGGLRMFVPSGNLEVAENRRSWHLSLGRVVGVALGREANANPV